MRSCDIPENRSSACGSSSLSRAQECSCVLAGSCSLFLRSLCTSQYDLAYV